MRLLRNLFLAAICITVLLVCAPFANAATVVYSGTCGENLTWTLDDTGTLTISGTGPMNNYMDWSTVSPWRRYDYKKIVIEFGVTSIGRYAFATSGNGAEEVSISSSVTSIGDYAFKKNKALEYIEIPDSVTDFGNGIFSECGLTDIKLPNGIKEMPYAMFEKCPFVVFDVPNTVTGIWGSFINCTKLERISVPDGVDIGSATFENCTSLELFSYPEGDTWIEAYTFRNCINLKEIVIPESVQIIDVEAFYGCSSVKQIELSENVEFVGVGAFAECDNLECFIVDENNTYYCNDSTGALLSKNKTVLHQLPGAFEGDYWIPEEVVEIARNAFNGCTALAALHVPANVTYMWDVEYINCKGLDGIWVDEENPNFASDSSGALYNKDMTWLLRLPQAFEGIYAIKEGVQTIDENACSGCTKLTTLIIPEGATPLYEAFSDCTALSTLVLPSSITYIGRRVFVNCTMLKDVYYGGTEEQYGQIYIDFENDTLNAANVYELMGKGDCGESLYWHLYEDGMVVITGTGGMFNYLPGENMLSSVQISPVAVIIANEVTSIGDYAFQGCERIEYIELPASVTHIGKASFDGCNGLRRILFQGNDEQWKQVYIGAENAGIEQARVRCEEYGHKSGDLNGDYSLSDADALYLLRHTLFPERYPLGQTGDVNGDGETTDADALYLLRHTLFPGRYPLY